jgi:hypothetical protein
VQLRAAPAKSRCGFLLSEILDPHYFFAAHDRENLLITKNTKERKGKQQEAVARPNFASSPGQLLKSNRFDHRGQ